MMNQPPPGSSGVREVSPRKKKGQISFAQPSFLSSLDLDDITNKKVAEDMQLLLAQLQKTKKERDALQEHCDALEAQLHSLHKISKEAMSRRQLEEDSFRSVLGKCKAEFDKKLVKLSVKSKDRDDLLLDWVTTVTDLSLHLQHDSLRELRARSLDHLPPSLRELVRGEKAAAAHPALRSRKLKKGARVKRAPSRDSGKGSSVVSTDPDALLAIINENMSVLDNFNLKHLGPGAGESDVGDSEASDPEAAALIRGGYNDYLSSSGAGTAAGGGAYPPSRPAHYSGLTSQARYPYVPPEQSALQQELEEDERFQAALDSSMAASAALEASSRQGTGKGGSRMGSRAGTRGGKRRTRTPGSPSRRRKGGNRGDSDDEDADSVGSGTITGSIMDHNDPASDGELPADAHYRYGEEEAAAGQDQYLLEAAIYDMSLSNPHSLTAPDPGNLNHGSFGAHGHNMSIPHSPPALHSSYTRTGQPGGQQSTWGGAVDSSHLPAHPTPRSTEVLSPAGPQVADNSSNHFAEAMRNLQGVAGAAGVDGAQGGVSPAEQRRRMSEMSANYTDMVRNILDSVSELSRSFIAEEDGEESSATVADVGLRPEEATGTKANGGGSNQRASRKGTARGPGGAAVEAGDSGIGAELAALMQDAELAEAEVVGDAKTSLSSGPKPVPLDVLLAQAGVTLDGVSNLSEDNVAYTPFSQDGAGSLADSADRGAADKGAVLYSEQDIERMIRSATAAGGDEDESAGDTDGGAEGTRGYRKGRKLKKKNVSSAQSKPAGTSGALTAAGARALSSSTVGSAGSGAAGRRSAGGSVVAGVEASAGDYSFTFEASGSSSQQSRSKAPPQPSQHRIPRGPGEDGDSVQQLKLGGEWDSQSENTAASLHQQQQRERPPGQQHRRVVSSRP